MYSFLYKKTKEYVNTYTVALVFLGAFFLLASAIVLAPHAKDALNKIIKNAPKKFKLVVIVPDDCNDCFNIYKATDFIKETTGIQYKKVKEYKKSDKNADLLIKTHEIKSLPTFVLQGEVKELQLDVLLNPQNVGKQTEDTFVFNNTYPPYVDVELDEVKGRFALTYINDTSCKECYNVYLHDQALENLIMAPSTSSTIDVASEEGKNLVKKYNIKHVPTILLRGDMSAYGDFNGLWQTVGTIEEDETYVFREAGLKMMGVYKDLQTKKIFNNLNQ